MLPSTMNAITIVRAGGPELAKELEKSGYAGLIAEAA